MKRLTLAGRANPPVSTRIRGMVAERLSGNHDTLREGSTLGIIVATGIWGWVAVVDVFAGQPAHTFTVLGGITAFTVLHYLLNIAFGLAIVSAIHGAAREPSLAIAVVFGLITLEIAFAMLTVLLSNLGLGALAWVKIFGGSLVGTGLALFVLSRRHPLAAQVRHADSSLDAG